VRILISSLLVGFFTNVGICQLPQLNLSRQAIGKIDKKNWVKAEQLLQKSLRKEAINPEAKYVLSSLYLTNGYSKFNIDSADYYLNESQRDYEKTSKKDRERLRHFPIDSIILQSLRNKIDSAAFVLASETNTEQAYTAFLKQFFRANQRQKAIELRDAISFNEAVKINSSVGFKEYLEKYPTSAQSLEAKKLYERLLFTEKTRDGKLINYTSFLQDYPNSEYKIDVEKNIFEISTASGTVASIESFLKDYPNSYYAKKATAILFHLIDNGGYLNDSLKSVANLNKHFWIPIFKDGKFGFIDQLGTETLSPRFESIDESYLCGNVSSDYLITSSGVIARTGKVILNKNADKVEDLGFGFLKIKTQECWQLTHKSGFKIGNECVQDAKVIASHFVATKQKGQWSLFTFSGRLLCNATFDDIYGEDDLILFVRAGKKVLKTVSEVAQLADNIAFKETLVFDEVRTLGQGYYQVRNGSLQGVLTSKLEYAVPLDRQIISQTPYGFLQERNNKIRSTGITKDIDNKEYISIAFYNNWIKLQEKNNLILYDGKNKSEIDSNLDSIWFDNKLAFARKQDSLIVYLSFTKSIKLDVDSEIKFIKSPGSIQYFYAADKKKKMVVEISSGKKLFSLKASQIEYLGNNTFLIEDENKKGLVDSKGKILLPIEYNAIVLNGKNHVSLLKDKKFGLYSLTTGELVKPIYERNVIHYSVGKLIAYKNGFYGFVSRQLKDESKFEFDEVSYWNDSIALVKKNMQWALYSIAERKITSSRFKDVRFVTNTEKEKVAIVHQDEHYGIIDNHNGIILACNYNDIINLGSREEPLYFTEKFVTEADIHVVIYYNSKGKLLRKQVYETKDYEKIYCEDN
jgi:hypothetical protein